MYEYGSYEVHKKMLSVLHGVCVEVDDRNGQYEKHVHVSTQMKGTDAEGVRVESSPVPWL